MNRYGDYKSTDIRKAVSKKILFLPVGSIEQHGPHLPLTVDTDIAKAISEEIAKRFDGIIAPEIVYSGRSLPSSGGGPNFDGTIFMKGYLLTEYFIEIISSFINQGAKNLFILNAHFENESFIFEALEVCREKNVFKDVKIIALSWWSIVEASFIQELLPNKFFGWHAEHASICETSLMMYIKPNLVSECRVDNPNPPDAGIYYYPMTSNFMSCQGVLSLTSPSSSYEFI